MATILDRRFLDARGRDARAYVHSMVSNSVDALAAGEGAYALLLTPKARIVTDMAVFALADDHLVVAVPPAAADDALATLLRSRFRRKVELEPAEYALAWGEADGALARLATPAGPLTLLRDAGNLASDDGAYDVARVEAGVPAFGAEFDATTMPAEAGLDALAIDFAKGCYPGQEPVARLRYRGHANRGLRGLAFAGDPPAAGAPVMVGERQVGRLTTAVRSPRFGPIALAVLRREVADGDEVTVDGGVRAEVRPLPFGR